MHAFRLKTVNEFENILINCSIDGAAAPVFFKIVELSLPVTALPLCEC
jgi:hypothetical protein